MNQPDDGTWCELHKYIVVSEGVLRPSPAGLPDDAVRVVRTAALDDLKARVSQSSSTDSPPDTRATDGRPIDYRCVPRVDWPHLSISPNRTSIPRKPTEGGERFPRALQQRAAARPQEEPHLEGRQIHGPTNIPRVAGHDAAEVTGM